MCAADELVVSVTCIAKLGTTNEAAHDNRRHGRELPHSKPAGASGPSLRER
jgi:hypothetical protein